MDDVPPSYESAIRRDYWSIIAKYIDSSDDLCSASRVCKRWHQIYTPLLWGDPASHFRKENERVYVALTRFKRSLRSVRSSVRSLTHTLHLPPAQAELYGGPHPEWLRDVLMKLPNLQSLVVSQLPFFDHTSLVTLRSYGSDAPSDAERRPLFTLRLLIANQCANTTQRSLADALAAFPYLVFLDLSRTLGTRDAAVLSKLRHMDCLQILKLCGIQLRDDDMDILAESIGTRVRSLDVRDNLLTDDSARTLLHSCFQTMTDTNSIRSTHSRGLSGVADEDWPSGILKPDPAVLAEFRDESFDERYLRRLTQGLVSRLPSEDQAQTGITHLYIANNHLTVEGVSSLIKSARLHVLDAGVIDTVRQVHRPSSSFSPTSPLFHDCTVNLPGAEKLTPVLTQFASKNLTSLRVDHSLVTKVATSSTEEQKHTICEMDSDAGLQELHAPPIYELPSTQEERFELAGDSVHLVLSPAVGIKPEDQEPLSPLLARRGSIYAPQVVQDPRVACEGYTPVLTATGLGPDAQSVDGFQGPVSDIPSTADEDGAHTHQLSPFVSQSSIEKRRHEIHSAQSYHLHSFLPSMLPQLRSLTLTNVPCYDDTGLVIDALINFIRCCASECELTKLQASLDSKGMGDPFRQSKKLREQAFADVFAFRRITLEMGAPDIFIPRYLQPGSSRSPQMPRFSSRTRSATEDADSEAFWAAQEQDFSFFDDDVECGLPYVEPGSHFPLSTLPEKIMLPPDNTNGSALPTLQQSPSANSGRDVVQELIKFRKDRKAAYESALKRGQKTAEGYWPGEVKVVRGKSGKPATVDYYGNYFE
ncbi:MAG: hypothetical protein Q9170_004283 [Blastenia crenularia]